MDAMGVMETGLVIAVVDDDAALLEALDSLLRAAGFWVYSFASAEQFLDSRGPKSANCLILDVRRLNGVSGLALQKCLAANGFQLPIVFITAQNGVEGELREHALRAGAVAFIRKPFADDELLNAVRSACVQ